MAESFHVQLRETRGKRRAKRLRQSGLIPAILYGHGEPAVSLSVPGDDVERTVRHGQRLVQLTGAAGDQAFIREMQWDVLGTQVLHVDLTRVSEHDRVDVMVALHLRGEAPGLREGGVLQHLIHEVHIECLAVAIPDRLQMSVNDLHLHDSITLAKLELPANVKLLSSPEAVVVQCVEPVEEPEAGAAVTEGAEPEIIGKKPTDEAEEEE